MFDMVFDAIGIMSIMFEQPMELSLVKSEFMSKMLLDCTTPNIYAH